MEYWEVQIRDVWTRNFGIEMARIDSMLEKYNMIAFDTEFPGFLRNTPRYASEEARYADLKFNVDKLKLIQLGLTLFDDKGRIGGSWQFNFSDFDIAKDLQVEASIRLLRSNGINFERNRLEGVDINVFRALLKKILAKHREIKWVTFHGLYDVGYFLKVLTQTDTPGSVTEFAKKAGEVLGCVYDVKFMAKLCNGLMDGLLGLEKLSKLLMVKRVGEAHQAGSDSLLTARVFSKMVKVYGLVREAYEGLLFGVSAKIEHKVRVLVFSIRRSAITHVSLRNMQYPWDMEHHKSILGIIIGLRGRFNGRRSCKYYLLLCDSRSCKYHLLLCDSSCKYYQLLCD